MGTGSLQCNPKANPNPYHIGFRVPNWFAVEDFTSNYYIEETLIPTIYTHDGNLV